MKSRGRLPTIHLICSLHSGLHCLAPMASACGENKCGTVTGGWSVCKMGPRDNGGGTQLVCREEVAQVLSSDVPDKSAYSHVCLCAPVCTDTDAYITIIIPILQAGKSMLRIEKQSCKASVLCTVPCCLPKE